MKRILEGSRILYVQRHRGWSLLLLLAGAVLLALAPVAWRKRDWGFAAVLTAGALTCFVAASAYLVESRVLLIDRAAGRARVLTRALFRRSVARDYELKGIRVRVRGYVSTHSSKVARVTRERQEVSVEFPDRAAFTMLSGVGAPYGESWGQRLAEDLNGKLIVDSRAW